MTTATASAVNYDELYAWLLDDLNQQSYDFICSYLSETTELEGVEYQNLRDEVIRTVSKRLVITVK